MERLGHLGEEETFLPTLQPLSTHQPVAGAMLTALESNPRAHTPRWRSKGLEAAHILVGFVEPDH